MQSLEKFFLDGHGGVDMTVSLSPSYTLPSLILKVRGQMGDPHNAIISQVGASHDGLLIQIE